MYSFSVIIIHPSREDRERREVRREGGIEEVVIR